MPVITQLEEPNLWKSICAEFEEKRRIRGKDETVKDIVNFDPAKHSAVFFNQEFEKCIVDDPRLLNDFDPSVAHPACYGYSIKDYVKSEEKVEPLPRLPNRKTCTEREFIEHFIFPTLLPGLEEMLKSAKKFKCFERKRTAFNACDFITKYLYQNNPFAKEGELDKRAKTGFWDIPFVKSWNEKHPRPLLPKSLIWNEEEAALRIQAFYRGYLVRRDPEVQELRQWQKELREENQNIVERVEEFWKNNNNDKNNTNANN